MTHDILFEEIPAKEGSLGIITLNRPQALNSLSHTMIKALYHQLQCWENSAKIKAVIVCAVAGRAFCAGGDIRLIYEKIITQQPSAAEFFYDEYQLNRKIYHYSKPYISFLDGITMGGGVGISIHGSHKVATENLLFAMPETGIGFFPDVGGTYFLPRITAKLGYYLGLSGARINCDDSVAMGIADIKVAKDCLKTIIQALQQQTLSGDAYAAVSHVLQRFAVPIITPTALIQKKEIINQCFSETSVEGILQALENTQDSWCNDLMQLLLSKSPTSLKITLQALQLGQNLEFDACMQQEYRLVTHFLQAHDFSEGIRAAIIDKDQKPSWQPSLLSQVSEQAMQAYFLPINKELIA